ncbi:MAG: response regulator [Paracoccaceae bacterium]
MNPAITFEDKTVLLVEDELFLIEKITEQLEMLGVQTILTATTLEDARDHISDVEIDLALLDVNLPNGATTTDLGAELSERGVSIVFFSGFSVADADGLTRHHEFLEKPLSVPRLKAAMQRALLRASRATSD